MCEGVERCVKRGGVRVSERVCQEGVSKGCVTRVLKGCVNKCVEDMIESALILSLSE